MAKQSPFDLLRLQIFEHTHSGALQAYSVAPWACHNSLYSSYGALWAPFDSLNLYFGALPAPSSALQAHSAVLREFLTRYTC